MRAGPLALLAACLLSLASNAQAELPSPLPLAWCLERAQAANPDLAIARTSAAAAEARV